MKLEEEIKLLKEDLRQADSYFIVCSSKLLATEKEIDNLKLQAEDAVELRSRLARTLLDMGDTDVLRNQITALYSTLSKVEALHYECQASSGAWRSAAEKLYLVVTALKPSELPSSASQAITDYETLDKKGYLL